MADYASTARPYAKALFELAGENDAFDTWTAALEHIVAVTGDGDFRTLINEPRVSRAQIAGLLIDVSKQHLPVGGENFVSLLVQNDRLDAVADIQQQFAELVAKAQASVHAEVLTAMALTEQQKSALQAALEKRLGLKVQLEETIDSTLVGGAIVKAGDLVIDGSARGRIEKLTTALLR